jgi:arginase
MSKKVGVIGVPIDLGASRRGVDMGPSALRVAQVGPRLQKLGYDVVDYGNIHVPVPESVKSENSRANYVHEIVGANKTLAAATYKALSEGRIPLSIGGDHSIAMGSVSGISRFYREKKQKIGLIWLDAHGDINTPDTSQSGNIHGMPVAHILGIGNKELLTISDILPMVDPANVVLIGLRDLDPGEVNIIRDMRVRAFTMRDIDELSLRTVMDQAIRIASDNTVGFHCSLDVDWIDPSVAPGVGTPVRGGATYREAHLAMEMIHDSGGMLSMDVAEVNPVMDHANETANLAVEMVLSGFGKRIL